MHLPDPSQHLPLGLATLDAAGRILHLNPVGAQLLGVNWPLVDVSLDDLLARVDLTATSGPAPFDHASNQMVTEGIVRQTLSNPGRSPLWIRVELLPGTAADPGHRMVLLRDESDQVARSTLLQWIIDTRSAYEPQAFLESLTALLARLLNVEYAFIDRLLPETHAAETLVVFARGKLEPNFHYSLLGTPCEKVASEALCCYPDRIQQRFPLDDMLVSMGAESYAGIPLWGSDGVAIGLIAVMGTKVMSKPQLTKELLQIASVRASQALESGIHLRLMADSDRFNRTIMDVLPVGIAIFESASGRLQTSNRALEVMMGAQELELVGRHWTSLHPTDAVGPDPSRSIRNWRAAKARDPLSTRLLAADGSQLPVEILVSAADTSEQRDIVIYVDRTQYVAIENRLREVQKFEAIGQLAAGVAHNFNNILAAILGNAELARASISPADVEHSIDAIITATERATRLTEKLLTFAGRGTMSRAPQTLNEQIEAALYLVEATAPKSVTFDYQPGAESIRVQVGADDLQRIILNLCSNAIQALGGKAGRVRISSSRNMPDQFAADQLKLEAGRAYALIEVEDNGQGIAPDHLPKIFDPFFTTRTLADSSGLGLSVVRGIIRDAGGSVDVSSQVGKGSTFRIYLPEVARARENQQHREDAAETREAYTDQARFAGLRVLLLDDEVAVLNVVQKLLERFGCQVRAHDSPQAALDALVAEEHFDLAVIDYSMPGMDGVTWASHAHKLRPALPICLITGVMDALSATPESLGFAAALCKPFNLAELEHLLEQVVIA